MCDPSKIDSSFYFYKNEYDLRPESIDFSLTIFFNYNFIV